jgi:hypothetical protein
MNIESLTAPIAGERFKFRVTGGTRPTHIDVYINRQQVLDTECADPPCHEMVFIPQGARGAEIWIVARDTFGNIERRRFEVGESDAGAGGTILVRG